jgi:hypothetical protein
MAQGAAGAAPATGSSTGGGGGGQNPFQIATNLYAEKNLQGLLTNQLAAATAQQFGGSVNAGQYLRGVRLMVRTSVAPATFSVVNGQAIATSDGAFAVLANADLTNVDGSEILYNMSAYAHYLCQKYGKPWLKDRVLGYDYQPIGASLGGSFTLFMQPEIRFTAGVLANTDTRSQYRLDYTLAAVTAGTPATYNIIPYMDAWAQPDGQDLQATPNQPVPPGVNLQVKRRHQIFTTNGAADNTFLSTLTGNAIRLMLLITRNASNIRVDGLTDPIYWQLDNRSLGRLNPDILRQWVEDQYGAYNPYGAGAQAPGTATGNYYLTGSNANDALPATTGAYALAGSHDLGVYAFPRFMEPGELYGQGWLYTANSSKVTFESTGQNSVTTTELVTEEVYPVGNVDPTLVDI